MSCPVCGYGVCPVCEVCVGCSLPRANVEAYWDWRARVQADIEAERDEPVDAIEVRSWSSGVIRTEEIRCDVIPGEVVRAGQIIGHIGRLGRGHLGQ